MAVLPAGCGHLTISPLAQRHARTIEDVTDYELPAQAAKARGNIGAGFVTGGITAEERDAPFVPLDPADAGAWDGGQAEALGLIHARAVRL